MEGEVYKIEEKFYKVWLTLIDGLGIKTYTKLLNHFKTNKTLFCATKTELMEIKEINEKMADNIINEKIRKSVKKHLQYMDLNNIDIIFIGDENYPNILKNIYDPPICIYIKGNKDVFKYFSIGIVGCRECSEYGKMVTKNFSFNLACNNINIISGLARGIDSQAHLGAVYAKGITTAVLGSGLDIMYPKENIYLEDKILSNNGAIVSEYPLGTKPNKINFPARNRIISGLSKGVLVVEAKIKSGTLITVDFALEQGRDVFVVPRKHKFEKF